MKEDVLETMSQNLALLKASVNSIDVERDRAGFTEGSKVCCNHSSCCSSFDDSAFLHVSPCFRNSSSCFLF
jgi:hypothetical protein